MNFFGTKSIRTKIIITFVLIFSLFLLGSGITTYNLVKNTAKLRYLVGLHEIEDIRQDLFSSIQKVSLYVFASPETFADHLDEIILNTNIMHNAIRRCNDCHHEPEQQNKLDETQLQVDAFEQQLSYLITMVSNPVRRHTMQEEVYATSTNILNSVQSMVNQAAQTIDRRTVEAMDEMNRSYFLMPTTLFFTIILALLVARYLTRSITGPIEALLSSTRKISEGQWGFQTDFQTTGEFQELIDSFNHMSETLAIKREQEQVHLIKLNNTHKQLVEAEKLTALGTMAGGIAHDFNNILCGMIGHLNILAKQIPRNEDHIKTIETIEKAGFRAADLVKQLLTFARQRPMKQDTVSINKCVNDVVLLMENTFDKRIILKCDLDEQLPAVVGDAAQLEQVIVNLCINARDAMPEGGKISLKTELFQPDDAFCDQQRNVEKRKYVLLNVQDTGCGINEKILPRIFDPFFTTKDVGKGTGLGLAIVYGIVQNHGGFCTIDSTPGRGTSIKVYIPSIDHKTIEKPLSQSVPSTVNKTILIVDDEPMVVAMLQDHLESLGCRTLSAGNGQIAVNILRENKEKIDLVVLDINMPVMGGREAYQEFIQLDPDIKVLVSTGYIMNEDTEELLNMGAQGFLQKPYTMEEVNAKVTEILIGSGRNLS